MVFEQRAASDRTRTHDGSKTEALTDDDPSGEADAEIRLLDSTDDVTRLMHLFNQVWGTNTAVVGMELIRAIGHAGGYVAAAYAGEQMIGGSLGFLARHLDRPALHSHLTGILPGVRHTGLGRSMKLHQRAWAASRGLDWVTWTFDPLVRRNAWFNIGVLGAEVHEYLVDFYGPITTASTPATRATASSWPGQCRRTRRRPPPRPR